MRVAAALRSAESGMPVRLAEVGEAAPAAA
jgi:hypothetical protein